MADNPKTIASLKRRIERLEAELQVAKQLAERNFNAYRDVLYECVEWKMRVKHAAECLNGIDSP